MTIPIIPGPFQFLGEAGQAAGAYGEEEKQRKQRLSQIAEKGYSLILQQIMQGADPSILDDPGVRKMGQLGYGTYLPAKAMAYVGAPQRAAGAKAIQEIGSGVPAAQAKQELAETGAATAQATLDQRTTEAFLAQGGAEGAARLQLAQQHAAQQRSALDLRGLEIAHTLFGPDKQFTADVVRDAVDPNLLKAEIDREMANRERYSLERQLLIQEQHSLATLKQSIANRYKLEFDAWNKRFQAASFGRDPEDAQKWLADPANAPPDRQAIVDEELSDAGITAEEFQSRWREAFYRRPTIVREHERGQVTGPPPAAGAPAPTSDAIPGVPGSTMPDPGAATNPRVPQVTALLKQRAPEEAGQFLATARNLTPTEKSLVLRELRRTMPGAAFRRLKKSYDDWRRAGP